VSSRRRFALAVDVGYHGVATLRDARKAEFTMEFANVTLRRPAKSPSAQEEVPGLARGKLSHSGIPGHGAPCPGSRTVGRLLKMKTNL
jgi:hypothetical protein